MSDTPDSKVKAAIARSTDPDSLRQFMKNARIRDREDLYWLAFERLCEVLGRAADDPDDPIAWRLERCVRAFEEVSGHHASRTRQMMKRRGSIGTIKQWLTYDKPTEGYTALVNAGLWRLLGEAIPLDFPDRFCANELAVSRYRIADARERRVSDPFLPQPV